MQITHCPNYRLDDTQSAGNVPPIEIKFDVEPYRLKDIGHIATPIDFDDNNAEQDLNRSREHLLKHLLLQIRMVDPIWPISREEAVQRQKLFRFKETRVTSRASIENGLALMEPSLPRTDRNKNSDDFNKGKEVTRQVHFSLPDGYRIKAMYPTRTAVNDSITLQVVSAGEDNPPVLLGTHQEGERAQLHRVLNECNQLRGEVTTAKTRLEQATNESERLRLQCETSEAEINTLKKRVEVANLEKAQIQKALTDAEAREQAQRLSAEKDERKQRRRDSDDAKLQITIDSLTSDCQQKEAKLLTLEEKLRSLEEKDQGYKNKLQQVEKHATSLTVVNNELQAKIKSAEMKEQSSTRTVQRKLDAALEDLAQASRELHDAEEQKKKDAQQIATLEKNLQSQVQTQSDDNVDMAKLKQALEKAEEQKIRDAQTIANLEKQAEDLKSKEQSQSDDNLDMAMLKEELANIKKEMEAMSKEKNRLMEENDTLKQAGAVDADAVDADLDANEQLDLTAGNASQAAAILKTATRGRKTRMTLRRQKEKSYTAEDDEFHTAEEEQEADVDWSSSGSEFKPPEKKKKKTLDSSDSSAPLDTEGKVKRDKKKFHKDAEQLKPRYSKAKTARKTAKKEQEKTIPTDAVKFNLFQEVEGKKVPTHLIEAAEALAASTEADYLDQLNCFHKEEMSRGKIILVNIPANEGKDPLKIPHDLCGFQKFQYRGTDKRLQDDVHGWHVRLVRLHKDGTKYKLRYFIEKKKGEFKTSNTMEFKKRGRRPHGHEEPGEKKTKWTDWQERQSYQVYEREENEPYILLRSRHRTFAQFPQLQLIETQVVETYNLSDEVNWTGKVAFKFQGLAGSKTSYILGDDYMPHPTKHHPDCSQPEQDEAQEAETEKDEEQEADDEHMKSNSDDDNE